MLINIIPMVFSVDIIKVFDFNKEDKDGLVIQPPVKQIKAVGKILSGLNNLLIPFILLGF